MRTINSTHIINKSIERAGKTVGIGLAIMFFFGILADSVIMPKIIEWQDSLQFCILMQIQYDTTPTKP
jgi:hypothetical protein